MKGRHCPRLLGPERQPQRGVNAHAAASQVLFITPFEGSRPGVSPSVNTAENMLIRSTNWQQIRLPGPLTDEEEMWKSSAVVFLILACTLHTANDISLLREKGLKG